MEWDSKSSNWNAMSKLDLQGNIFEPAIGTNNSMFSVDLKLGSLEHIGEVPINTLRNSSSPLSKRGRPRSSALQTTVYCSVDGCISDLSQGREYHRRHRVCERHSKTPVVVIGGREQRFCQQCSRFHSLGEFDDAKRSCRKRLDGHNRRRRKTQPDNMYMSNTGGFQTPITGSELLQFRYSDNWPVISEPEKALYGINHPVSSLWSTAGVKEDKQLPYALSNNQQTLFQSPQNVISSTVTKSSNLDTVSDRVTKSPNSGCALSLLSMYPTQSSEICNMGPAIPPLATSSSSQVNRAALHLDYSLGQFSSSKDENSASLSSRSTTSNSHIFEGFHSGTDAFSENRLSRVFPFSW